MDCFAAGKCCGNRVSCISTSGCPKKTREISHEVTPADKPIKLEECDAIERYREIFSPPPPTRTWASIARSLHLQNTHGEFKASFPVMPGTPHRKNEPFSTNIFVQKRPSVAQGGLRSDGSESRSDSGVGMDIGERPSSKSKDDFTLTTPKKRKSATDSCGLDDDMSKRRKGVAYPVKKCKGKPSGRTNQSSRYMSEEEAEAFRAKQKKFVRTMAPSYQLKTDGTTVA